MSVQTFTTYFNSPIGTLEICADHNAITQINFLDSGQLTNTSELPILKDCVKQLDEYFKNQRHDFNINIHPQGTEFQKGVWNELLKIPYGQTDSYLGIAKKLGNVMASRAVGNANGKNPIPILIPCHRVIGSDGKMVGYGGGLWRKKWLLKHENALLI